MLEKKRKDKTRKYQERGHSLIGKTSILHIVNLGSTPTVSNVKVSVDKKKKNVSLDLNADFII